MLTTLVVRHNAASTFHTLQLCERENVCNYICTYC